MKKLLTIFSLIFIGILLAGCQLTSTTTSTTTMSGSSSYSSATTTSTTTFGESTTTTSTTSSVSTTTTHPDNVAIDFYSINDFHGGAYTDISTLAAIGGYFERQREENPYSIILASGDIFQGTPLSNYYHGRPIVDVFDQLGLASFTLGNHEFDWGIDEIANYADSNPDNGEANFPILAANIVYQDTLETLPWTEPYVIEEINGIRIGIIGVIGEVINSISASRVENITFLDPGDTVYEYAGILRTEEDCDIVIASIHDFDQSMNSEIASFNGDHYVDAVFNGHTHSNVSGTLSRSGVPMAYAQASNGSSSVLAKITLTYNYTSESVTGAYASTLSLSQMGSSDTTIQSILTSYAEDSVYTSFVSEVLATADDDYYRSSLAVWGASVIRDYMSVDIGILNSGGFRVTMESGEVTMGDLIQIYPFDNFLKTVYLYGSDILDLYYSGDDVVFDDGVTDSFGNVYIDGVLIDSDTEYLVAAVDYVFDKSYYPFLYGRDATLTDTLMRDLLAQDLRNTNGYFSAYDGSHYVPVQNTSFYYQDLFRSILTA